MDRAAPSVLLVAYGAEELLDQALTCLGRTLEVVVVDNSLSEAVRSVVQRHQCTYVAPERNLGFAGGVNLGLTYCAIDHDVLLLNPDARLTADDVLCLQAGLAPGVAAVAPMLRRPTGEVERTTWPLPRPLSPWLGAVGLTDRWVGGQMFLSGAVLMLNYEALREVGAFDSRFFLYAEESDWQFRALNQGWTVLEHVGVEAIHVGGATSNDPVLRELYFHSSAELYIRKWYGGRGWRVFCLGSLVSAARRRLTAKTAIERERAELTMRIYLRGPRKCLAQALGHTA